jgi:hypothetical protein
MVAKEIFKNCYYFNPISLSKEVIFKVFYFIKLSGAAIWICSSGEPEPKLNIFASTTRTGTNLQQIENQ